MIDVTYGVLNYNPHNDQVAEKALMECVYSLHENRDPDLKTEVVLIDQGSERHVQRELLGAFGRSYNWQTLFLDKNVGISRGINLLARMARGKYVSLVTSDTIFPKGLDTSLIDTLENNKSIMQICPASDVSSIESQKRGFVNCGIVYQMAQELTIQFWPRTTFDEIGYFDERWKACYENLDYALRIYLAGGVVAIDHNVSCLHKHNMTTKNRAIDRAYDGYLNMPNGLDHAQLRQLWEKKWPGFPWALLYEPLESLSRDHSAVWDDNIHLPFLQDVGY